MPIFSRPTRADQIERGPTAAELAAIAREWPAIAADLAEIDAYITKLLGDAAAVRPADTTSLTHHRARRAARARTTLRAVA